VVELVVYTAIYGDRYDTPKPVGDLGVRAVLYTDNPHLDAPGWEVRYEPMEWIKTPMLQAKFWKCHPLGAVDADASVWIDGSLIPHPGFADRCREALGDHDWALTPHPLRTCIYTELAASIPLPKYRPADMDAQCAGYKEQGHPRNWGLFASGAMTRRHTGPVARANRDWWLENWTKSWQDQLSLPVILRANPDIDWVASMPWAQWWDYQEHGA